jgi:hypothetical protein
MNPNTNTTVSTYAREHLSPTKTQRQYISKTYAELKTFLDGSSFRSGSYARHTATRPVKDLDVIWVTNETTVADDPRKVLVELAAGLDSKYKELSTQSPIISSQEHSIKIEFNDDPEGFSVDVVPGIRQTQNNEFGDPIFCVPSIQKMSHFARSTFEGSVDWIYSDPKGYVTFAQMLDDKTEGRMRKAAKVVKAWRQKQKRLHGDDFKLKSFHVEQIATQIIASNPSITIVEAIFETFAAIPQAIQFASIADRADATQFIDQYVQSLSTEEKSLILNLQSEAFDLATQLLSDPEEVVVQNILDQLTKLDHKPDKVYAVPTQIIRPQEPWQMP